MFWFYKVLKYFLNKFEHIQKIVLKSIRSMPKLLLISIKQHELKRSVIKTFLYVIVKDSHYNENDIV